MHILFLSRWFPLPATNGSKIRISNLLRGLASEHQVTLLTFYGEGENINGQLPLDDICHQMHAFQWQPFDPSSSQQQRALFSVTPRSVAQNFSPEFADCIKGIVQSKKIDLIIASQFSMANYAPYFGDVPAIFEEVELSLYSEKFSKTKRITTKMRHRLMWAKHKAYMRKLTKRFAYCTVASEQERHNLARIMDSRSNIAVIPNSVDATHYTAYRGVKKHENTLIFTGAFTYHVNHVAMRWFLAKVYKLIQMQNPAVQLRITGDHANLSLPPATNVVRTGFVDDIKQEIAAATIAIVPLLHGGGTRLKILEAMLLRTPVVSTSKGAEGLDCVHGTHLLIADTAAEFAAAVNQLLSDSELRDNLVTNAHELIMQKYDWSRVLPEFLQFVNAVVRDASDHVSMTRPVATVGASSTKQTITQ